MTYSEVNNGAEDALIEGNLFFNQSGSDEHIDINSVVGVTVQDNIFINTAERDGPLRGLRLACHDNRAR